MYQKQQRRNPNKPTYRNMGRGRGNQPRRYNPNVVNRIIPRKKNNYKKNGTYKKQKMPATIGTTVGSYFQNNNDNIVMRCPIPANNCSGTIMIVPFHPLFWNQKIFNIARNFTGYKITRARVYSTPSVPTTDTTSNTLASTQNCSSVNQNLANITNTLQNMGGITASAFLALDKTFPNYNPTRVLPIIPMLSTDISTTAIIANTSSTVTGKLTLWIDVALSLYGAYNGDDISAALPIQITLTFAAGTGVASSNICLPFYGFVISSTASSVDLMEFIVSPGFTAAATPYTDHVVTHNSTPMTPLTQVEDQGIVIVLALQTA